MKNISKTIRFFYCFLFFLTPFLFTFINSELFEIPKMYFVYFITLCIFTLHLINWISGNTPLFKKSFFDIPLILFLLSQTICTLNSIDIHSSFYGYYSRLNGGLLSIVSFSLLYWSLIPYLDEKLKFNIINSSLISGFLVAIYGILEHFGIDKNLWVQDVQSRVFSTLGQPNWLAAYLCILLPLSIYQFLESKTKKLATYYLLLTTSFYLCLLFTKSKSGIIATTISLTVFFIITFFQNKSKRKLLIINYLVFILLSLLISNPIKEKLFPANLDTINSTLEINNLNITPSQDIRKIVWQGSLDLFKKYPILGTGVETFAYSYYWTRPVQHNLTSEWDFLYNKAHNEYLNYLATTGLVGFVTYIFLILTVLFVLIKNILNTCLPAGMAKYPILNTALLSSYLSILITNGIGFSVVITSIYFFLIPVLINLPSINKNSKPHSRLKFFVPILIILFLFLSKNIFSSYFADILYAKSESSDNRQEYQTAYDQIYQAVQFKPLEPNYLINLATANAKMAVITKDKQYIDQAIKNSTLALQLSPANINFWKLQAQMYYYLATIDTQYFTKTIESMYQASLLAPTDAKIFYSLGQFLESAELLDDAVFYYQKAIELKSNYDHAYFALGKIYYDQKQFNLAKKNLELNLRYAPTNTAAQEILDKIKK